MADLKGETTITLDESDVLTILTEALCRYGPMDELRAYIVKQNNDGTFTVTLEPKPVLQEAA